MLNRALAEEFNEALARGVVLGDWTLDNACDGPTPTAEGDTMMHHFVPLNPADLRCMHCDGYPFDFQHWCTG